MATYFEKSDKTEQPTKSKKRYPLKESECQNPDDFKALCHKLRNWDNGEKFVGTTIVREFNIKGTEAGHKIKLLALELEANIPGLEIGTKSKSSLKKYQKSDISMPAPPTCKRMKVEERKLIETNVISVGFPCCPLPVTYYTNGEKYEKEAMGRKYSLTEIRQMLLDKHRHLMRLSTDHNISQMRKEDILALVSKVAPSVLPEFESKNLQGMQTLLKGFQRNRALWVWSDHSVLLGHGLVLIVVGAVYDPLVYFTDNEIAKSHKSTMTVQEMVERGEVYIMAHCSSSSADQAGLIPERVACLDSLSDPIVVENGLRVHDSLRFFKGDKQSAWFEAGIQRGGYY